MINPCAAISDGTLHVHNCTCSCGNHGTTWWQKCHLQTLGGCGGIWADLLLNLLLNMRQWWKVEAGGSKGRMARRKFSLLSQCSTYSSGTGELDSIACRLNIWRYFGWVWIFVDIFVAFDKTESGALSGVRIFSQKWNLTIPECLSYGYGGREVIRYPSPKLILLKKNLKQFWVRV